MVIAPGLASDQNALQVSASALLRAAVGERAEPALSGAWGSNEGPPAPPSWLPHLS